MLAYNNYKERLTLEIFFNSNLKKIDALPSTFWKTNALLGNIFLISINFLLKYRLHKVIKNTFYLYVRVLEAV